MLLLSYVDAGVDGVRGTNRTVVYGDGRVLVPNEDAISGLSELRLSERSLAELMASAQSLQLLKPNDFGEPGITDQGWSTIAFTLESGTVEHRVYAPSYTDGLESAQVGARERFSEFGSLVQSVTQTDPVEQPKDYEPTKVEVRATPLADDDDSDDPLPSWPLDDSLRDMFGDNGCAVLSGDELKRLLAEVDLELPMTSDGGRLVTVLSDVDSPRAVNLQLYFGIEAPDCGQAPEIDGELPAPWPADDRRRADGWAVWIAKEAVIAFAESGKLGSDASSSADLTWYAFRYSMGTVDGRNIVDVSADAQYSEKRNDPKTFDVRVDLGSGEVLDFKVG